LTQEYPDGQANALAYLAQCFDEKGNFLEALKFAREAQSLQRSLGEEKEEIGTIISIGFYFVIQHEYIRKCFSLERRKLFWKKTGIC
jgi:hypothetical protein